MSDGTAIYLTSEDHSEAYLLANPAELQQKTMILSDPETGKPLHLVDRKRFFAGGYRLVLDQQTPPERKRPRRFRRRGASA
jgi:hypothetical protein